jgi:hypothetical protein
VTIRNKSGGKFTRKMKYDKDLQEPIIYEIQKKNSNLNNLNKTPSK